MPSALGLVPKSMQSVLQSSGRAPGAMGSKFSLIFLREISLGEKLYFWGQNDLLYFLFDQQRINGQKNEKT